MDNETTRTTRIQLDYNFDLNFIIDKKQYHIDASLFRPDIRSILSTPQKATIHFCNIMNVTGQPDKKVCSIVVKKMKYINYG